MYLGHLPRSKDFKLSGIHNTPYPIVLIFYQCSGRRFIDEDNLTNL